MAIRFDIKWGAEGWNQWGTIPWGPVSKTFQSASQLQGVKLQSDVGDGYVQISSPRWPKNNKVWSVKKSDIVETVVDDTPTEPGDLPVPPNEVVLNWRNAAGELLVTQAYVKKNAA